MTEKRTILKYEAIRTIEILETGGADGKFCWCPASLLARRR